MLPDAGLLVIDTAPVERTAAGVPSTRWPEELLIAFAETIVRVAASEVSRASLIVPLFSASVPDGTLMPSVSASTPPVPLPPDPGPCTT